MATVMARRRHKWFDMPGKASAWGLGACAICAALHLSLLATLIVTLTAALAGCFNG